MAKKGKKISEVTELDECTGLEQIPFVSNGANGRVSVNTIKKYATSDLQNYVSTDDLNVQLSDLRDDIARDLTDKVDVVEGKGLSTNDYTDEDKSKLDAISDMPDMSEYPTRNEMNQVVQDSQDKAVVITPELFDFTIVLENKEGVIIDQERFERLRDELQSAITSPAPAYYLFSVYDAGQTVHNCCPINVIQWNESGAVIVFSMDTSNVQYVFGMYEETHTIGLIGSYEAIEDTLSQKLRYLPNSQDLQRDLRDLQNGKVSKAGDTMTGALTVKTGAGTKVILDNTDGENFSTISFRENGSEYANITANDRTIFLSGRPVTVSGLNADFIQISQTDGSGNGIALCGSTTTPQNYGIFLAKTEAFGKHGGVQGDYATYLTMDGATNRGWVFKHKDSIVASISSAGTVTARAFVKSGGTSSQFLKADGSVDETQYVSKAEYDALVERIAALEAATLGNIDNE